MKIFTSKTETYTYLQTLRNNNNTIGFVPTMGSLHKGHLNLILKSGQNNDCNVCSIFVNPTQFNNPNDYNTYPRDLEKDIEKLKLLNCDVLFAPNEKEIYSEPVSEKYDLDGLDEIMEGKYRPGHFNGVVNVVKRLFDIVEPCNAYFGEKDYQQLAIIRHFTKKFNLNINIQPCSTVREDDGLAMSSRNNLLSPQQRKEANLLYNSILFVKHNINKYSINELKNIITEKINSNPLFKLEYIEIAHKYTLLPTNENNIDFNLYRCFIAAYMGNVRLIDNIALV